MIIITGAARSGTTVTAEVFKACGANFGDTVNKLNEDSYAKQKCKDELRSLGCDPLAQRPLPKQPIQCPSDFPAGLDREIIKEAKIAVLWQSWAKCYPDAKWVLVRRDTESLLDSLHRTPFMKAYKHREDWRPWIEYHLERIEEIKQNCDWVETNPKEFILQEAIEYCGYTWNESAARNCFRAGKLK